MSQVSLVQVAGGLGIFLVGMIVMTSALRALAGDSIRRILMAFTRSPATGAMTGAFSTALLQSSSATTVAAVGFVGAGLMSFPSALGIVFGANLGTTITGWIVALVGFKLHLISLMYPVILIGALMRLFLVDRYASLGLALAGFGLIFVGIDQMQQGMAAMQDILGLLQMPTDTGFGRLKLLLIGAIFTMLTQSSSAGVAAVLAALFSDAITLTQGLALVVGMDIGTTITAVMATIGGSTQVRRTGYSHFIYNLMTGLMAFVLLVPYVRLWEAFAPDQLARNTELILVGFHSAFNLLGVLVVLPFTTHFARLMERLIPETSDRFNAPLDDALLAEPPLALAAVAVSASEATRVLLHRIQVLLAGDRDTTDMRRLQDAINDTHRYADRIHLDEQTEGRHELVALFHALDHLQRLHERCDEDTDRAAKAALMEELASWRESLAALTDQGIAHLQNQPGLFEAAAADNLARVQASVEPCRAHIMRCVADGAWDVAEATARLEAVRWLSRVSYHIAQIATHLNAVSPDTTRAETTGRRIS